MRKPLITSNFKYLISLGFGFRILLFLVYIMIVFVSRSKDLNVVGSNPLTNGSYLKSCFESSDGANYCCCLLTRAFLGLFFVYVSSVFKRKYGGHQSSVDSSATTIILSQAYHLCFLIFCSVFVTALRKVLNLTKRDKVGPFKKLGNVESFTSSVANLINILRS